MGRRETEDGDAVVQNFSIIESAALITARDPAIAQVIESGYLKGKMEECL